MEGLHIQRFPNSEVQEIEHSLAMTGPGMSGDPFCRAGGGGIQPRFWDDPHLPQGLCPIQGLLSILVSVEASPALPPGCGDMQGDCPVLALLFEVLGCTTPEGQEAGRAGRKKEG